MKMQQRLTTGQKIKYSYGAYNKCDDTQQWIRITEGCPHNCPYCYEPQDVKIFGIPEIVRRDVKIMDMNLLCKPESIDIIKELGTKRVEGKVVYYELVCGIDFRFLTKEIAKELKLARFTKIRVAWDWFMKDQYKIKDAIDMLKWVGYKKNNIMVFMICNWRVPYNECCRKLDLCKIWNVQVSDCYFDNQTFPNVIPLHWTDEQNKSFRSKCRTHNQMINFGIDPDVKVKQGKIPTQGGP